jgi:hypothetical protein
MARRIHHEIADGPAEFDQLTARTHAAGIEGGVDAGVGHHDGRAPS